jgi:guanylate kinase
VGKLICIVGKSGAGKDTLFRNIIRDSNLLITPIIPCTTRPIRKNEINGVDYHFVSHEELIQAELKSKLIEKRVYRTVKGDWYYFTKDFCLDGNDKLTMTITTPAAIGKLAMKFGKNNIIIVYLEANDLTRIERCLQREMQEQQPDYKEVCRRYLADEEDFALLADEDLGSYYSCFRINANQSVCDCKKQFDTIYKTIKKQIKISKEFLLKSVGSNETQCYKLCHDYLTSPLAEGSDFNNYFETEICALC